MIKAVCFDFDGVLTLDETGSQSICNYVAETEKIDKAIFEREYRKYNKNSLNGKVKHEEIWSKICDAIEKPISISALYNSFINTPINTKVLDIVKKVKSLGLNTAMITDNKSDRIKNIVAYHKWERLFDCIAVSAEIGVGKSDKKIFDFVFESLHLKPHECIFIDNNKDNLTIPQKQGVKTIFFNFKDNDVSALESELRNLGVEV